MDYKNFEPHQILNIKPDASEKEILKAFKKLMLICHPDLHRNEQGQANNWSRIVIEAKDEMLRRCRAGYRDSGARQQARRPRTRPKPQETGISKWIEEFIERESIWDIVEGSQKTRKMYMGVLEKGYVPAISTSALMRQVDGMVKSVFETYVCKSDYVNWFRLSYEGIRVHEGGGYVYGAHEAAYRKIGSKLSFAIERAVKLHEENGCLDEIDFFLAHNMGVLLLLSTSEGYIRLLHEEMGQEFGSGLFGGPAADAFCRVLLGELEEYHVLGNQDGKQMDWASEFSKSLPSSGIYKEFSELVDGVKSTKGLFRKARARSKIKRFERNHPGPAKVKL